MKGVIKVKKKKEADLGKDSLGPLLLKLALPAILAQIINVLYNMVDRMYIGHIPKVGPSALTGVGVTMPVIMAISAFAALVSMGGASPSINHVECVVNTQKLRKIDSW